MASIVKLYRDASFGSSMGKLSSLKRTPMCKSIISAFPHHHLIETVFAFCLVFFSHMGKCYQSVGSTEPMITRPQKQ